MLSSSQFGSFKNGKNSGPKPPKVKNGGAFLTTTPASIVGDVIRGKGGKVIGIFQMAGDAGMMIGPIVIGAISDVYSYRAAFGFSAAIFVIALALVYQIPETRNVEGPQVKNLRPLDEDL